MLERL
jgi:hypothetical protein